MSVRATLCRRKSKRFFLRASRRLVFTPGSANLFGRSFFDAAVGACQQLGRRGILLTRFAEQLPPSLPSGVVHFDFVPLSLLLPRCAAFVNHGGIGSVSQAMAAGIPQLMMPLAHDQIDNAARIARLGVGSFARTAPFYCWPGSEDAPRTFGFDIDRRELQSCRAEAGPKRWAGTHGPGNIAPLRLRFLPAVRLKNRRSASDCRSDAE